MCCQTLNKCVSNSCLNSPSSMSVWRMEVGRLFESRGPVTAKLLMSKSESELLLLCKCLCRLSEDNGRMSPVYVCVTVCLVSRYAGPVHQFPVSPAEHWWTSETTAKHSWPTDHLSHSYRSCVCSVENRLCQLNIGELLFPPVVVWYHQHT